MSAPTPTDEVDELIERMRAVRASGYDHAGALHGEAKRLVDWKEYVRSKPLVSIAVASLVGFSVVRGTFRSSSPSPSSTSAPGTNSVLMPTSSNQASWKSSVIALATNVATTAVKHYFTTLVQRGKTGGGFHDRFRNAGSKEETIGSD